jgi:hypothetical protein
MKKYLIIASVVITLALIAGGVYVYLEKQEAARLQAESAALAMQKLTKETDALSVNVAYPIIPGSTPEIARANAAIREDINKRIQSFEKDAKESASLGIGLPQEVKSTVTGSPATEEKNERYVVLFMGMEWYLRGAAHPSHSIDTYIFDYEKGKLVSPSDLFRSGSAYLERLSALSKEDLMLQSSQGDTGYRYDENMVNEGTFPLRENFSRLLPLYDGLVIYFNEYQVAPYAAGPQQVVIPYVKLQDIIDPNGVLGMYFKK